MSTRPRIEFNKDGICNACTWAQQKKSINWVERLSQLQKLLENTKQNTSEFDCLVPVSGGKDGSYVAYQLKHKYGLNPLTITIRPPLEREIGQINLQNFIASGFEHIHVTPNQEIMRKMDKYGFAEMGFPYLGWLTAMQVTPIVIAKKFGISLIFYGEDGEVEYGGSSETNQKPFYDTNYMRDIYLEGGYEAAMQKISQDKVGQYFYTFPTDSENIRITHWSYFENWDPYRNYILAKEKCGLTEISENNSGTFTNYSQNDQKLYALHCYMMYLKFGFGRATQDAGIEIRRGNLTRSQAVHLVQLYDHEFPEKYLNDYLEYYQITSAEFFKTLDKFANKNLLIKEGQYWLPNFKVS
jgi:N-acetyl sugar amidotransferase